MRNLFILIAIFFCISLLPSCQKEVVTQTEIVTDTITDTITDTLTDTVTINLKRGLIAYYPFSGNANDSSGNNKHGQLMNGTTFSTDAHNKLNSAASFDGLDDYITIPDSIDYFAPPKLSISFLVNLNDISASSMIFNKGAFASPSGVVWGSGIAPDGKVGFTIAEPTVDCFTNWVSNPSLDLMSATSLQNNKWMHVTFIYNLGVQLTYINGVLDAAKVSNYNYLKHCKTANLKIGGWWQNDIVSIHGKVDEIRIYNRILAENEIEHLAGERN